MSCCLCMLYFMSCYHVVLLSCCLLMQIRATCSVGFVYEGAVFNKECACIK